MLSRRWPRLLVSFLAATLGLPDQPEQLVALPGMCTRLADVMAGRGKLRSARVGNDCLDTAPAAAAAGETGRWR